MGIVQHQATGADDFLDLDSRHFRQADQQNQQETPNPDLGVIETVARKPSPPLLVLSTDQRYRFLDNVFLAEPDRVGSSAWNGWFELELAPYATYLWRPRLTIEHEMYRFQRAPEANFDSQTVRLESSLGLTPDRHLRWDLSYAYWRVTAPRDDEVFRAGEASSRLSWVLPLNSRLNLTTFWEFTFRTTSPGAADFLSHELHFSLAWFATSSVALTVFAEPEWRFYPNDPAGPPTGRDFHLDTGFLVQWAAWEYLSVFTELRWTTNSSNVRARDYQLLEPSLSLFASVGF